MNDVLHGTKASFFQPLQQHAPAVRYLLPMSWRRIDGIRPVFNDVSLNGSGLTWVTYADVPESYCLSLLYDELSASYPEGFLLRGCCPDTAEFFSSHGCSIIRTGAEAVLDLSSGACPASKKIRAAIRRGRRHGTVQEIPMHDMARESLAELRLRTAHGCKPVLRHVFRNMPEGPCRCFAFLSSTEKWLAAVTVSRRGAYAYHTELMLRDRNAPGDIMETLISGVAGVLSAEGAGELSLGEVPFVIPVQGREPLQSLEALMVRLASWWKHAYDSDGLFAFKDKFQPCWRPSFLCASRQRELSAVVLAELAVEMGFSSLFVYQTLKRIGWPTSTFS
ncbi:phosphatidylglycerol lysyltransferase domain-containing protein [Prosthecochloris sp. HL-130-GSB]|jgi:glycosyltransferase 2 family protein|uniref:phosphatidylglycerol lysyltransferase domain-containing protein n=1 Tax=Prosthecochloris sp. HL-130-GSB TaxID=1974213 RepID=UPI000A1C09D2|nr:phosphatidylglycerol lysyltransferase domain-containing protein [Prosthecochloris sp. HL-130-GSB]ARM31293.1 hypothetical protein B9H02_08300 [Prosthecochloris sp. HL-130-GSB]MBO8093364.1 DUF2156 domain-containing protein [Prosthecochloris sp.]